MADAIGLLNLDIGPQLGNVIRPQLEQVRFGPLRIEFAADYEAKVRQLTRPPQFQSSLRFENGMCAVHEFTTDARFAPDWVCTARLIRDDSAGDRSVIAESPIDDGGIWDLCELLTFFTGRRVTVPDYSKRYGAAYRHIGRGMKIPYLALHATAHSWANRVKLVERGMQMALLSQNQAVSEMIQTQVSHYATALDIVCAKYPTTATAGKNDTRINDDIKLEIKQNVEKAVVASSRLSDPQKASFIRILNSRIDQGLAKGFLGKLQDLLTDFGAVDANPSQEVFERIRLIDTLRNAVIHNGRLPKTLPDGDQSVTGHRIAQIGCAILPEITAQAFYRVLQFAPQDRDRFGLQSDELRHFFMEGKLGPTVTDVSALRILDRFLRVVDEDATE